MKTCIWCDESFEPGDTRQQICARCVPYRGHFAWKIARAYGISFAQYEALLRQQGNACAICHRSFENMLRRSIHVDHDHVTKEVRGILCNVCNQHLAPLESNWRELAEAYLKNCSRVPRNKKIASFRRRERRRQVLDSNCKNCLKCHEKFPRTAENFFDHPLNRMTLCSTCGNKRCPRATDHDNACTGSNEPGQPGSNYT